MSHDRNKSIFIEKMALKGEDEIRLITVLLQGFLKVCHEIRVYLPSISADLSVELTGSWKGCEEVCQHADPGLRVLQSH